MINHHRSRQLRRILMAGTALLVAGQPATVFAQAVTPTLPPPPTLVQGSATFAATTNTLNINQTSNRVVLDWSSLNLAAGQTLRFNQTTATGQLNRSAIALNRITGAETSFLDGSIIADGQVWILNPNGIFIGSTGSVSASGFLATTLQLQAADLPAFMNGSNQITLSGMSGNEVVNEGQIIINDGGYAVLAGAYVVNGQLQPTGSSPNSLIRANLGYIALANGSSITLSLDGDRLINFAVAGQINSELGDGIVNTGDLIANGGNILMKSSTLTETVAGVINTTGLVQANSVMQRDGQIILDAGTDSTIGMAGTVQATGGQSTVKVASPVVLIGDTTVRAGGSIEFESTIGSLDGPVDLTLDAASGDIRMLGDVGFIPFNGEEPLGAPLDALVITGGQVTAGRIFASGFDVTADAFNASSLLAGETSLSTVSLAFGRVAFAGPEQLGTSGSLLQIEGQQFSASSVSAFGVSASTLSISGGQLTASVDQDFRQSLSLSGNLVESTQFFAGALSTSGLRLVNGTLLTSSSLEQDPEFGQIGLANLSINAQAFDAFSLSFSGIFAFAPSLSSGSISASISNSSLISSTNFTVTAEGQNGLFQALGLSQINTDIGSIEIKDGSLTLAKLRGGSFENPMPFISVESTDDLTLDINGEATITGGLSTPRLTKTGDGSLLLAGGGTEVVPPRVIFGDPGAQNEFELPPSGGCCSLDFVIVQGGTLILDPGVVLNSQGFATPIAIENSTLRVRSDAPITFFDNSLFLTGDTRVEFVSASPNPSTPLTWQFNSTVGDDSANGVAFELHVEGNLDYAGRIGSEGRLAQVSLFATDRLQFDIEASPIRTTGEIRIGAGKRFVNNSVSFSPILDSSNSRWLIWSGNTQPFDPEVGDQLGSSFSDGETLFDQYDFKAYGISEQDFLGELASLPAAAAGNGVLYSVTPTAGLVATGSATKVYDGNAFLTSGDINISANQQSVLAGDNVSVLGFTANFSGSNVNSSPLVISAVSFTTVDSIGRPVFGYAPGALVNNTVGTITPRPLSLSLVGSIGRPYDGTSSATLLSGNFALSGLVGSQRITVNDVDGSFASPNAGNGIVVTAALTAADFTAAPNTRLTNYLLPTSVSGAIGTITPRLLTGVLVGSVERVYDGTRVATVGPDNLRFDGLVAGETITANLGSATYATANAGQGIVVSAAFVPGSFAAGQGTLLSNYQLPAAASGAIGVITPKPLSAALIGTAERAYDGTARAQLVAANFALSGFVNGEGASVTSADGVFATRNVGTGLVVTANLASASFSTTPGTLLSNYVLPASASAAIGTITPKALAIALVGSAERIYDATTTAALSPGNYALSGLAAGDTITVSRTQGIFASPNAGNGILVSTTLAASDFSVAQGTLLTNYQLPASASGLIGRILPRPLAASLIGSVEKIYDGNTAGRLEPGNLALSGLVAGEQIAFAGGTARFATENAGSGIVVSASLTASNFTASAGTLLSNYALPMSASAAIGIITPRPLNITLVGSVERLYDTTTAAALAPGNFALSGLVAGDAISVTRSAGVYATPNAGTGLLVTTNLGAADFAAATGTLLGNYQLPGSASGLVGRILPRPLTASLTGTVQKAYDGTAAASLGASNVTLTGLVAGEQITVSGSSARFATVNVGTNILVSASFAASNFSATAGTLLGNYVLPTAASAAIGAITPLTLTYLANVISRPAGAQNPDLTGTVTGFIAGESLASATTGTLRFESSAGPDSPAGSYAILGSGLSATNYVFVQAASNATALTVTSNVINEVAGTIATINNAPSSNIGNANPAQSPAPQQGSVTAPSTSTPAPGNMTSPPLPPERTVLPEPVVVMAAPVPPPTTTVALLPASSVEPTPASPVANQPDPVTPDADDAGDPVLKLATDTSPTPRSTSKNATALTQLTPEISVEGDEREQPEEPADATDYSLVLPIFP